ncbi:MAG: hypothetical protein ACO3A2_02570 [Bdellovibrionia bacterium]
MESIPEVKRFKTNPIEVVIVLVVSLIFFNSLYNLIYEYPSQEALALLPAESPIQSQGSSRLPASTPSAYFDLELDCNKIKTEQTRASKIRITGTICALNSQQKIETSSPQISIKNSTNEDTATVFQMETTDKFSTDYISLSDGENRIQMKFQFDSTRSVSKELIVIKN